MTKFRIFYIAVIVLLLSIIPYFTAWNMGFDTGYKNGYNTAIIEGHVEVTCKFNPRCLHEYNVGYQEGLQGFIDMRCKKSTEDSDEPDSFTL